MSFFSLTNTDELITRRGVRRGRRRRAGGRRESVGDVNTGENERAENRKNEA